MNAEIVIFTFAALILAAGLFVRLRLGPALRNGRIPDPPPGRLMLLLELGALVFLCLLIPRRHPRPDPMPETVGSGACRPSREGPPETEPARRRSVAERHADETGGDG